MKKILLVFSLLTAVYVTKAQSAMFLEGDKNINLGIGLIGYPILTASLDYCIADEIIDNGSIGVGGFVAFGQSFGLWYTEGGHFNLGARGTFHYPLIDDLDTYAGLGVGLRYNSLRYFNDNADFYPGFFLGANYNLSDSFKVFGELGSGNSYLTVGIVLNI